MSDEIAHDGKAVLAHEALDGRADVADPAVRQRLLDALIKAGLRHADEAFDLFRNGTDRKGGRAVAVIALIESADVDFDDVAVF